MDEEKRFIDDVKKMLVPVQNMVSLKNVKIRELQETLARARSLSKKEDLAAEIEYQKLQRDAYDCLAQSMRGVTKICKGEKND